MIKSHLTNYLVPDNINGNWNYGFLLAMLLLLQIFSGILAATIYSPYGGNAFESLLTLYVSKNIGWLVRYFHAVCVSIYFLVMYFHVTKGLSYSTRYIPWMWYTGWAILVLSIIIAFLGYTLPNGQMSFWGATVILNLFYWVGDFVSLLMGGFSVESETLGRFYILHFSLPFVLLILVLIHIFYLHCQGSTNPVINLDALLGERFLLNPAFCDLKCIIILFVGISLQIAYGILPIFQGDHDNSIEANSSQTPEHIVPEWYLLVFYAALKLCPGKFAGLLAMIAIMELLVILSEARAFAAIVSCAVHHRNWTTALSVVLPALFILGSLGQIAINLYILKVGAYIICAVTCCITRLLDLAIIERVY
uniref:Cytochrome b n=1 Tax=Babesia duncani TaxID=323732 RepID=A0A385GNF0_9APIC|nr:cytochrome b [Babesia duncani]AXX76190.1 cytochrome b [Babesia duncani]